MQKTSLVINRLIEANLKLEHYWFIPKAIVVPVKKEKKNRNK